MDESMLPSQHIAFKEWNVVCAALGSGQQSLILRKGGIHEGREGFRVLHREFWLFPTAFHQGPEVLAPAALPLLQEVLSNQRPDDEIRIRYYVDVIKVVEIHDQLLLPKLNSSHIWSERTIHDRFHYKTPGLFAMIVRTYQLPIPLILPMSPHFAGCRSWVDLPTGLSTAQLTPVLSDEVHANRVQTLERLF
jgi:hypothetical protein